MATTAKKIESNRANSENSTGPKSMNGKQRIRFNAMSSGIYAKIRVLPHESELAYHALAQQIFDQHRPQGPVEEALAQQIVYDIWRLRRLESAEHAHLKHSIETQAKHRQYAGAVQILRDQPFPASMRESNIENMLRKERKAESIAEDLSAALAMSVSDLGRIQLSTMIERLRWSINRRILQNLLALEKLQESRGTMIEVVREDPSDQAIHESRPQEASGSGFEKPNAPNSPETSDSENADDEL